eukprot:scaffold1630_cov360-Pavlova_lutheri.AAC.2
MALKLVLLAMCVVAICAQTSLPCFNTAAEARTYCLSGGGGSFQSIVRNGRGTYTCNGVQGSIGTCGEGPVPPSPPSPPPNPTSMPSSLGQIRHTSDTCQAFTD